jgi:hypothetical protein
MKNKRTRVVVLAVMGLLANTASAQNPTRVVAVNGGTTKSEFEDLPLVNVFGNPISDENNECPIKRKIESGTGDDNQKPCSEGWAQCDLTCADTITRLPLGNDGLPSC